MQRPANLDHVFQTKRYFRRAQEERVSFYSVAGPFRSGPLPKFIIVGVDKGGTTSLFYNLAEHPQIVTPVLFPHWEGGKGIHYFSYHYCRGLDWYRSPSPSSLQARSPGRRREPISRALRRQSECTRFRAMSHFKHWVREDKDDLRTFNEVIVRELNGTIDDR